MSWRRLLQHTLALVDALERQCIRRDLLGFGRALVDNAFVLLSDRMASREWGYVAGSRHRDALHVYADRSGYESLVAEYAESKSKGMALDEVRGEPGILAEEGADAVEPDDVDQQSSADAVDFASPGS